MNPKLLIAGAVILLVVVFFGKKFVDVLYLDERAQQITEIARHQGNLEQFKKEQREKYPPIEDELRAIVDQTLGHDRQTVEAGLRARLNRFAERYQLAESVVSTGRHSIEDSPAKRAMPRNPFRSEPDFAVVEGTLSGTTTLEQAMRLMDAVEHDPWIKRIDSLDLDPNNDANTFDVTIRLTTMYIPGRKPDPSRALPSYNGEEYGRVMAFVNANPFAKTAAAVAQTDPSDVVPTPPPPPAPSFPYEAWLVTGVVHGLHGWEVWLVNNTTNQSSKLKVGQQLGDAVFVSVSNDDAIFELGDSRFLIRVGSTLVDRTPIETGQGQS